MKHYVGITRKVDIRNVDEIITLDYQGWICHDVDEFNTFNAIYKTEIELDFNFNCEIDFYVKSLERLNCFKVIYVIGEDGSEWTRPDESSEVDS